MNRAMLTLLLIGLAMIPTSCTQEDSAIHEAAHLEVPTAYPPEMVEQYSALGDSGYVLLEDGELDAAVAIFKQQMELIPEGKWGAYNIACAYGRNDKTEEGIEWLTRAIDGGWGDAHHLDYDTDLESLRGDPRFATLRARAEETHEEKTAVFAQGLPDYESDPGQFPDTDSLQKWVDAERRMFRAHGRVWYGWQLTSARLDHEARRLAALKSLATEDPDVDHGLLRIRALSSIYSPYQSWGAVSDGVLKEVEDYLSGEPSELGMNEAHYRAAVAVYLKRLDRESTDNDWEAVASTTRTHFSAVQPGTEYGGAAAAGLLMLDIKEAGDDAEALWPSIREFKEKHGEDQAAMRVASRFFQDEYIKAVWPIAIDAVDIGGEAVKLDQYAGKVLLIDFWAIWCGPCRAELPHLVEAHERFGERGFEILSISLDYPDRHTTDEYREWIAENGMAWRHIYDQQSWNGPLVAAFLVQSIPAPFLIGRDGTIVAMADECRGENLFESIEKALGQISM